MTFCAIVESFAQCQSNLQRKIDLVIYIRVERVMVEEFYAMEAK